MKGKKLLSGIISCLLAGSICAGIANAAPPSADYTAKRLAIENSNKNKLGLLLTDEEKQLDKKLQQLKADVKKQFNGNIPYDMPFLTDERLENNKLFAFCRELPKPADLHIHNETYLPVKELTDFLLKRKDIAICTAGKEKGVLALISPGEKLKEGFYPLPSALENKYITREEIENLLTVKGGAEAEDIWVWFETLFNKTDILDHHLPLFIDYAEESFRYYCRNNVMHIEPIMLLIGTKEEAKARVLVLREAYYRVRKDYPEFTVRLTAAGLKYPQAAPFNDMFIGNALYVHENVKDDFDKSNVTDFLTSLDLENEEDKSIPLKEFSGLLLDIRQKYPRLNLTLHAGETLVAGSDNIIDAYLLGVKRIGHGYNLYRYPELLELIKKADICLDVCPVSNQTLRLIKDLRNHPAVEYLKRGVPMTIASDDPSYQEATTLVDDYFAAVVCWDLGIGELKQLCQNSIKYSSLDPKNKQALQKNWERRWNEFVRKNLAE